MAREGMRENVAGLQQRDHSFQDRVGVFSVGAAARQAPELAEMNIDRQRTLAPDLGR